VLRKNAKAEEIADLLPDISWLVRYTFRWPRNEDFDGVDSNLNRIFTWVDQGFLDDTFGYHLDFQYQRGKLGQYPREAWFEEAYAYVNTPVGKVKAGVVYTPFGLLWDHTFYGSTIYYKGYMLDADYGVVLENKTEITDSISIAPSAGYFWRDNGLNGATVIGAGIEKLRGGEKNTFAGRLNSTLKFGDDSSLSLGASGLTGEIRHPGVRRQTAFGADLVYCLGPLILTGEFVYYDQDYPRKDRTAYGNMLLAEVDLEVYRNEDADILKGVILKYNYSEDLPKTGNGLGKIHLPAVCVELTDYFKAEVTHVYWKSGQTVSDDSWWLILYLSF